MLRDPQGILTSAFREYFHAVSLIRTPEARQGRLHVGTLQRELVDVLLRADEAATRGGIAKDNVKLARFAVVALTDDVALNAKWPYTKEWGENLFEYKRYKTNTAGDLFFTKLRGARRQFDIAGDAEQKAQLAGVLEIYLTCIRLGFRGARSPKELETETEETLLRLVPQDREGLLKKLCDDAYGPPEPGHLEKQPLFWWWPIPAGVAVAVGTWFLVSFTIDAQIGEFSRNVSEKARGTEQGPADGEHR